MRRLIRSVLLVAISIGVNPFLSLGDDPLPPRAFSHPDRIHYDSQCFTIEGKDTFIFSGAFHYFRCPKALWNDRFDKIKAAGFNAVETYVAWNAQEPEMPASPDDYSKVNLKDLNDWLTMAEAHGLYVILRPGPYICAEWDCGGFPQWLLPKRPVDYKGMWLRSDEPSFVAWSKHWFHAVDQVAVKHQLTHRAAGTFGIILYQLENEYGGNQPDDMEVRYVHALGQHAMDDGIDVPLFTCWTGVVRGSRDSVLRQVYDSCNFYPRWDVDSIAGSIAALDKQQPDAPRQTTELQGGWFSKPGDDGSLSKSWTDVIDSLSPAQIQNLTLYAIEKGDRVTNYYMLFGGTNFGDWAPSGITTSYDYSAPIREIGAVGEKYQTVAAIGEMLKEYGQRIARAVPLNCKADTGFKDVTVAARRDDQGGVFLFFRTNQHAESRKGRAKVEIFNFSSVKPVLEGVADYKPFAQTCEVDYDLGPFGSKVLYVDFSDATSKPTAITWLPKRVAEIKRPTDGLPTPIKLTRALTKTDPGPATWEAMKSAQSLEQMGIYGRRFVYYRTHLNLPANQPAPLLSLVGPIRDNVLTTVNDQVDPAIDRPGARRATKLATGDNTIQILYENVGQPNGGRGMEELSGISKIETLVNDDAVTDWKMQKITRPATDRFRPERLPEVREKFDDSQWQSAKIDSDEDATQLAENEDAVFRAQVDIPADQIKAGDLNILLGRMDDEGTAFINGKKVGEGHDWNTAFTFPATGLHEGKNSVAVFIHNAGGTGGLGTVRLMKPDEKRPSLPLEIGSESTGYAGQWWKTDLDETGWTTTPIDQPAGGSTQLAWSRLKFDLPETKPGIWVPWVARLHLTGNGFLYLNGHALGRYWQAGPQHDFFLPECWLNFGKGNLLTMCVRSVDGKPVKIESAEIVPVNEVAEYHKS